METGEPELTGAGIPGDRFQPMRSTYLTLFVDSAEEAERIYALLSEGGQILMRREKTFFASRFAMLRDKLGTPLVILHHERQG
jgi:PhnB protein